jgi:soluble lytic murein transglycosylase-like protein
MPQLPRRRGTRTIIRQTRDAGPIGSVPFALGFGVKDAAPMGPKYVLLFAALLAATGAGARARIYSFVDADGVRHFTDVPDNNRYRLLALSPDERTASGERYDSALLARAAQYDSIIEKAAISAAVEPNLLRAVIVVESGFNSRAVSKRGAVGLMQLMPATASRFGVSNPYDPKENVHAGARYLKFLMNRFGQNVRLALAAYNAGEVAVERSGGQIPPFTETMAYVPKVLKIYRMLKDQPRAT